MQLYAVFQEKDPEAALEAKVDANMKGSYPIEEVYKVCSTQILVLA